MVTDHEATDADEPAAVEATDADQATSVAAPAERRGEQTVAKALLVVAALAVAWGALGELSWYLSRLRWRWRRWYTDIALDTNRRPAGRSKAGRR